MSNKPFIEYAYDVMSASKEPLTFKELFEKTLELSGLELDQNAMKVKMSKLYTSLADDSRFALIDKKWDLSDRHSFSELHEKDVDYDEEDDDETDEEEKELLRQELGEEDDDDNEQESDDLDFDTPKKDAEDDDEDF